MSADEAHSSRRHFLASVASGASALAAVGLSATELLAHAAPAAPAVAQGAWDMSWLDRVQRAKHKMVFDSPAIGDGMALNNAITWLNGYREVYQTVDADMAAVLVFRHKGLPVALNDDMWARLKLGDDDKLKDPATGEPTTRNPFINVKPGDRSIAIMPDAGVDALMARGVIVIACNQALMRHAGPLAKAEGISREQAQQALIASVLPGVIRMPSGVFATSRAQEAGCVFIKPA
jgi:intracellular sulfur oxidation DsrE/DsrF family protein